jgi:hypothetical protein
MKAITTIALALIAATAANAADPAGPADKADSQSLSSGAKENSPATKGQGENEQVGSGSSGVSAGDSGNNTTTVPGTKKGQGASSSPEGVQQK